MINRFYVLLDDLSSTSTVSLDSLSDRTTDPGCDKTKQVTPTGTGKGWFMDLNSSGYKGEQVVYLSERIEGNYAEVRTELRSRKVEIPMDYRLFLKEGRWHAYDIIADGVSLVKNYRSQFEKIIRTDSYPELVRRLRDRTVTEERKGKQSS